MDEADIFPHYANVLRQAIMDIWNEGRAAPVAGHSIARGVIEDDDKPQYFPFTAHAVLTAFIVIVSIVIMNLLFGMAVSDVQVSSFYEFYGPWPHLVISVVKGAALMGS